MTATVVALRRPLHAAHELSDEALLAACTTSDAIALGTLFDRYHAAVYRFAARLQTTDELARDDLVQATFLEISRTAATFRGTSSVKTWILGIAANLARRTLRSEVRRRQHQAGFLERHDARPKLVDDEVAHRQLLARIADALATLPRDQQIAFVMCDLEQLAGVEVARVLGVPAGTLWRRLHMARKAMRSALEANQP